MATNVSFSGPGASSIVSPAYKQVPLISNYLDIQNDGSTKQYLPDLYEQEVDRYGNRTISGFLSMLSAEEPLQSDQIIWSEQGRLHLAFGAQMNTGVNKILVSSLTNADSGASESYTAATCPVRVGATVAIKFAAHASNSASVQKGVVTEVTDVYILVKPYAAANFAALSNIDDVSDLSINFFVYGSEFAKGTDKMAGAIEPQFKTFTNKPMIIKDHFEINGSDTAQIGWVEVAGEAGQNGYLWYLKSSGDTRARFNDYLEMVMVEAVKPSVSLSDASGNALGGSEGLFAAIESRGIVSTNNFDAATTSSVDQLDEFDLLLAELDKQGSIEENMLYLDRASNLFIDDFLANLSAGTQGGTAYGVFENSEDMALNLGFTGFRRGGYDFYKTDWKYLNDSSTRGLLGDIKGVLIPAGTSSVYDQQVAANVRRPFLHVRYRASQADDRKMKSWVTGSVGGPTSSNIDKMEINYLSERCLVVQAANNFVLFK